MDIRMNRIDRIQETEGMRHAEAMHKSHHDSQAEGNTIELKVDSFQKSESAQQFTLYNEKGEIIKV